MLILGIILVYSDDKGSFENSKNNTDAVVPVVSESIPGFEGVYAVLALLAIVYFIYFIKRRQQKKRE